MNLRWLVLSILAGSLATLWLLWGSDLPLGVSGEWVWKRFPDDAGYGDALLFGLFAAVGVAVHASVAWFGERHIDSAGRSGMIARLSGLTLTSFALLWILGNAMPGDYGPGKTSWVLYDRGASGYFYEATQIDDGAKFLAHYQALTAGDYVPFGETEKQRDVYHIGTHPPGLILFHRGLIVLCRASPGLTDAILATQPAPFAEAFSDLNRRRKVPASDRAALWLAVILTHLLAAATVVPLFLLARLTTDSNAAWKTAAFWPLVPALAVFLPKSDSILPLLATLFLWLWVSALRNRSFIRAGLSGLVMFVGLSTSLALLPVALLAVLLTIWGTLVAHNSETGWKVAALLASVSILSFFAAIGLTFWWFDCCLPSIWLENFRNHAGFYEKASNPRSYAPWLPANAVELTIAVGFPLMLLAGRRFIDVIRSKATRRSRDAGVLWCSAVVIGLLWISGKNMGEAGRLWLFLMPWILWIAAGVWSCDEDESNREWLWAALIITQAVVCWLTAIRVQVFFLL